MVVGAGAAPHVSEAELAKRLADIIETTVSPPTHKGGSGFPHRLHVHYELHRDQDFVKTLQYKGVLLIRNSAPLGPYSGTLHRALWWP